jgi:hypothetical protein
MSCNADKQTTAAPVQGAGLLQRFLDASPSYAELPKVGHTPRFSLEALTPTEHAKDTEWYYILDGEERIGLIQTWIKEIEMFRFFPSADGVGDRYPIPEVYHWSNLYGARLQMYGKQMLPPVTSFTLTFTRDRGDSLEFTTVHQHEGGIGGMSEYRLSWDERLGYVWNCVSRYSMPEPSDIEFNNLFAGGISESRNDRKRWQKTIRALADGRIAFVHHNPLNIPTDSIAAGGFVGFVTEPTMNPFVELLETSSPVFIVTCDQWYDQHILMKPPRTREADGLYHAQARYRFLSLPEPVARELEAAALPATARKEQDIGFLLNQTSDFEQVIASDEVFNGGLWSTQARSDEQAHSGRYSLKVAGAGMGKEISVAAIVAGPAVVGESQKRYRLSAWVKSDLSEGVAYLRIDDVRWNWNDVRATRTSAPLRGRGAWTQLDVAFQPGPHDPFLVVRLCVDGCGVAWFDDVLLEVIA